MADNQSKLSLATLTPKQKVVGVVTVVIVIFILYEVIGMFSGGSSSTPAPAAPAAAAKPMSATSANATAAPAAGGAAMPGMMPAAQPAAAMQTPGQVTPVGAITMHKDTEALKDQEDQQKAYLDSLNQLQLLKLKREIAETNQAIATARLATETANKNMSDLLTTPAPPQVPINSYASKLAVPGQVANPLMGLGQEPQPQARAPQVVEIPFVVISVSMQFQHWNAVLGYQGKLYSVSTGDTLVDGSTVASINRDGVVLTKDGKKKKLSIINSI